VIATFVSGRARGQVHPAEGLRGSRADWSSNWLEDSAPVPQALHRILTVTSFASPEKLYMLSTITGKKYKKHNIQESLKKC
jgi:hypothetical protein